MTAKGSGEWCVFYAHGGIDNYDFHMSIQRARTAREAAELSATEYGGEAERWVVPKEHVHRFTMTQVWKPDEFEVEAEVPVQ